MKHEVKSEFTKTIQKNPVASLYRYADSEPYGALRNMVYCAYAEFLRMQCRTLEKLDLI